MDGLLRSVGSALGNLFAGMLEVVGNALKGAVDAVTSIVPPVALPVIGIGLLVLVVVLIFRR
jgi:hypothetical protein